MEGHVMMWQVIIHGTFVVSAFMLAWTDRLVTMTAAPKQPHGPHATVGEGLGA